MTRTLCKNCGDEVDPNTDVTEQREHTTPCMIRGCGSHDHAACEH